MKAGRELDAEKTLFQHFLNNVICCDPSKVPEEYLEDLVNDYKSWIDKMIVENVMGYKWEYDAFEPSTDIADAWLVLNRMIELGAEINVGFCEKWDCSIDYPIGCNWTEQAETAPLAICLAALKACGIEVK